MSKIVVLTNAIGGLWVFRAELMEMLISKGFEVSIYAPLGDRFDDFKALGCAVTATRNLNRRGISPLEDIKLLFEYRKILKKEKPDVVLTYTIKPNIYGGLACQVGKIPYISNVTGIGTAITGGGILAKLCMFLYKSGAKKVSTLFFQNNSNEKLFDERKVAKGRHRLIPGSGVNLKNHSLKEYPPDEKINFLFVGRVMKAKGIEEFLFAVEKLSEKYHNLSFGICGICEDERYLEQMQKLSEKCDFTYYGKVRNIDDYYNAAHCVVLPSYHEGMANVLLEGQATGRPVISTRVPGCREAFEENVSGFACDARDKESLLVAMEKMLNLSNDERAEMGRNGRKFVEDNFDRNIVINAYIEEIQKILEEKKK